VSVFAKTPAANWWQDRIRKSRGQKGHVTMVEADLDRMLDLATPWCLMVAATLRLPDHIGAGCHDIQDLANATGCDRDALHALLGYLVAKGVFIQDEPGFSDATGPPSGWPDRTVSST
jgi:hypothetical protein